MKVRLKVASVRKDSDTGCPFGLPIPFGCKCAGKTIDNMAPFEIMGPNVSEDEKESISEANSRLLAWSLLRTAEPPEQCPYVGKIIEDKDAVQCNYNDTAPKAGAGQALTSAPFYPQVFNSSMNGLYTFPIGFYSDYGVTRNLFMGSFSLMGNWLRNMIQKIGA